MFDISVCEFAFSGNRHPSSFFPLFFPFISSERAGVSANCILGIG